MGAIAASSLMPRGRILIAEGRGGFDSVACCSADPGSRVLGPGASAIAGTDSVGRAELAAFPRLGRDDTGFESPAAPLAGGFREGDFFVSDMGRHSARELPRT